MPQRFMLQVSILAVIFLGFSARALSQSWATEPSFDPADGPWQLARQATSSVSNVDVVTVDHPDRRSSCRIRSMTQDTLVCSRALGHVRTYSRKEVAAVILPGDHGSKIRFVLALNAVLGTAIWGTVVLVATCPPCAVATGIVSLALFAGAGAVLIGDEQPDRLLYLAPGRQLQGKLRALKP